VKYIFIVEATISLSTEVEAETLEEAVQIAQSRSVKGLCYHCAQSGPEEWSTGGELDCDPSGSSLVDLHVEGDATAGGKLFEQAEELWS
jgi:hypothetical protein